MDGALLALGALACSMGMVLMMVFMGGGLMGERKRESRPPSWRDEPPLVPSMRLGLRRLLGGSGTASQAGALAIVVGLVLAAAACGSNTEQSAGADPQAGHGRPARSQPEGRAP
jgi:hypothetical protein